MEEIRKPDRRDYARSRSAAHRALQGLAGTPAEPAGTFPDQRPADGDQHPPPQAEADG